MFISFEGGDGVGKSTQIKMVAEKLQEAGHKIVVTREPGGTDVAEEIRGILKSRNLDPISELLLMFAARREHFVKKIRPALDEGAIVLCDRFYDSSIIYQGGVKHIPVDKILEIKEFTIGDFEPDLTILLDMDYKTARFRSQSRNPELFAVDEYDSLSEKQYAIISESFKKLARIFSDRYTIVQAALPREKVFANIMNAILAKL